MSERFPPHARNPSDIAGPLPAASEMSLGNEISVRRDFQQLIKAAGAVKQDEDDGPDPAAPDELDGGLELATGEMRYVRGMCGCSHLRVLLRHFISWATGAIARRS